MIHGNTPGDGVVHSLVDSGEHPALALADVVDLSHLPSSVVGQSQLLELPLCWLVGWLYSHSKQNTYEMHS